MSSQIASSCNLKTCILGENPRRRKTQGGQNAALREKTIASFHDLQVSSVPFRPSGFVKWSQPVRQIVEARLCPGQQPGLQRRRGSLGSMRLQRSVMQRAMWGPCVEVGGTKGPRKSSS
jgi:hypothetical protein